MSNHNKTPIFPDSYIGENSSEYDDSIWMERNQKKATLICLQYLYDEKLNKLGFINKLNEQNYLIADLGCGTGFSSEILVENGHRVVGIDILTDMLSKAKAKKKLLKKEKELELILADINHLPIRLTSIDHIISISAYNFIIHGKSVYIDTLKTINNTAKYLKKILKPNGRIIIEFYPKNKKELDDFISSFKENNFDGFMVKKVPNQKSGQSFLLLKKTVKIIGICKFCGKFEENISEVLNICRDCILKKDWDLVKTHILNVHKQVRALVGLPSEPPKANKRDIKLKCNFCINECILSEKDSSYCGLRNIEKSKSGELPLPSKRNGYIHGYLDPIPTNCCNAWFCDGDYNTYSYAAFLYGCSFNCLFCQNSSHKHFSKRYLVDVESLTDRIYNNKNITCICYFGGTPEVQLPFTINLSNHILEKIKEEEHSRKFRVCWEWNGSGNKILVDKCMQIAINSGGNIKFDLKAFNERLNIALCGVSNSRTLENFKYFAENYFGLRGEIMPEMSASTLLVPGYVNHEEVEQIAKFIGEINNKIPYSLLVFHPDYQMKDLPITSRKQANKCFETAKKYLSRVNLGNKFLLGFS